MKDSQRWRHVRTTKGWLNMACTHRLLQRTICVPIPMRKSQVKNVQGASNYNVLVLKQRGRLRVVWQDLGQDVSKGAAGHTTDQPSSGELVPTLSALQGVTCDHATGKGLHTDGGGGLEGSSTVDRKADSEDHNQASSGGASNNLSLAGVAERAELDEGASHEEAVGKANLHTTKNAGHAGAVGGEVGQVRGNDGGGGDWGLQHSNEGIAIQGLNDLGPPDYFTIGGHDPEGGPPRHGQAWNA
jgi:hypothetical protein